MSDVTKEGLPFMSGLESRGSLGILKVVKKYCVVDASADSIQQSCGEVEAGHVQHHLLGYQFQIAEHLKSAIQ